MKSASAEVHRGVAQILGADEAIKREATARNGARESRIDIDSIPSVLSFSASGVEFAVERLIALRAVTMLSGEPGHGKSTIATSIAHALIKGHDFCGRECSPRPVLLLDRENPVDVLWDRYQRLGITVGDDTGLTVWGGWLSQEAPDPGASIILDWVVRKDPKPLVIVDSASAFLEGDENSSSAVRAFMNGLRRLANLGASVILLHHTGKSDKSLEYRGSSDFKAAVDVGILVKNFGEGELGRILLKAFKNRYTIDREVFINYAHGRFFPEDPSHGTIRTVTQQLTDLLRKNPGIRKAEFENQAAALGLGRNRARDFLLSGEQVGEVRIVRGERKNAQLCYLQVPDEDEDELV